MDLFSEYRSSQMKVWAGRPQDIGDIERLQDLDR